MAEFDSILDCTLGTTSFQLVDYSYKEEAVVEDGKGKTGAKITISGEGYVSASATAAFSAALLAAQSSFRSSGQDFLITGLSGETEVHLLAAQCVDGGPHCSFEMLAQGGGAALVKPFRFTLTATTNGKDSSSSDKNPTNTYKTTIATRPDGLREASISGELVGPGCSPYYEATVLPFFKAAYPVAAWVPTLSFERNVKDDQATYNLRFVEIKEAFPVVGATATIVDGELTTGDERDEQMRITRTFACDFLITGDPIKVRDVIRAMLPATPIRERYEVSRHKETRIRADFSVLLDATGNAEGLLNWEQDLELERGERAPLKADLDEVNDPMIYQDFKVETFIVQKGSATGLKKFVKEAEILFPDDLAANPKITYRAANGWEFITTWEYRYVFSSVPSLDAAVLKKLARPDKPEFK